MIRWLALGLWYAAILFTSSLTSTPESGQPLKDYLIAKSGHVFVYGVLGWIVSEALTAPGAGFGVGRRTALAITIVAGAVLAALDETRQSFVYASESGGPAYNTRLAAVCGLVIPGLMTAGAAAIVIYEAAVRIARRRGRRDTRRGVLVTAEHLRNAAYRGRER